MARSRQLWTLTSSVCLLAALMNISSLGRSAQQQNFILRLTPSEILLYQNARTLCDWTPEEIRRRPELRNLQPAKSQNDLPIILQRVGEDVAALFDKIPNTTCTETVWSQGCGASSDSCTVSFKGTFRYLMLFHSREGDQTLEEHRTDAGGNVIDYGRLKNMRILTYGFAATALYFLPRNQSTCRFRYFGRQMFDGRKTEVVGFAQVPAADASVTLFQVGDELRQKQIVHLLVQGWAWIDAASFEILRIQTDLLAPRPDVGLKNQTTEINFSTVHLPETAAKIRLPTKVVVDVWVSRHHFRNIHEYSDFKLFRVESHINLTPKN